MTASSPLVLDTLYASRARTIQDPSAWPNDPAGVISLAYGFAAPEKFPTEALLVASGEVLHEDAPQALNYGSTYSGLITLITERMHVRGVAATSANMLVTHGSSQALALLANVFIDPGDTIIVEGPTFMGAVKYFAAAGARILSTPVDADGLDTDALAALLRAEAARGVTPKFIYVIPNFQNPTGALLPLARREHLIALAHEFETLLIEDDAYGELYFDTPPPPQLAALDASGRVIHVGTFSKILAPGVRTGFACAHPAIIERLAMFKYEGGNGPYLTRVVERFCADGRLEAHTTELRVLYKHKRDVMLAALDREMPADLRYNRPAGGFFVWAQLPSGVSANALLAESQRNGATFCAGTDFFADGSGDDAIRLAFSLQPDHLIDSAITRIAQALHTLRQP